MCIKQNILIVENFLAQLSSWKFPVPIQEFCFLPLKI